MKSHSAGRQRLRGSGSAVPQVDPPLGPSESGALDRAREGRGPLPGVVVGTLVGFAASGEPLVEIPPPGAVGAQAARSTIPLGEAEVGRPLVLVFEGASPLRPIILGLIQAPAATQPTEAGTTAAVGGEPSRPELHGERLELRAEREIVLRCGESSLTLTRAGKILIRGNYILSRSTGAQHIKGASVQIN